MLKSEKAGIINIFIKLYVPFTRKTLFDGQQSVSSPPACPKFHLNAEFKFLQKKEKKENSSWKEQNILNMGNSMVECKSIGRFFKSYTFHDHI